jgi:beta-glucanase (GH16 family)
MKDAADTIGDAVVAKRCSRSGSKGVFLLATSFLAICLSGAVSAETAFIEPPAPIAGKGYTLVKNWDFGANLKTLEAVFAEFYTRYVYDNGALDYLSGNQEWQRYREEGNHQLDGDALRLTARIEDGLRDGGISSGMLRSKWTGRLGYYECRIKVPLGRGLWPACWLNPQDQRWPPEIDIVEIVDNGRDTTAKSFHNVVGPDRRRHGKLVFSLLDKWNGYDPGVDYADDFHVFAVEWTETRVRHFVDGKLVAERQFDWRHADGSDGGEAHVLVNLAVGGKWAGRPQRAADFPAALAVDYVRVWQQGQAR